MYIVTVRDLVEVWGHNQKRIFYVYFSIEQNINIKLYRLFHRNCELRCLLLHCICVCGCRAGFLGHDQQKVQHVGLLVILFFSSSNNPVQKWAVYTWEEEKITFVWFPNSFFFIAFFHNFIQICEFKLKNVIKIGDFGNLKNSIFLLLLSHAQPNC